MLTRSIRFTIRNPLITLVIAGAVVACGILAWRDAAVDAIPDISESQVIVTADWPGRSPQDVEDQVTHPLATALASVRGVKEVRGHSGFGLAQVLVIFDEPFRLLPSSAVDDFYDGRTRVLEALDTASADLPDAVVPRLGPDATPLGQVFMYTVDGPYDLATLRGVQDFIVRYELQALPGVAEVASAGGMVRQYQVDVDPDRLRHFGVGILDVVQAVRRANIDVGAKTIESGGAEFVLRGLGFIKGIADVENVTVGYMTAGGFLPAGAMTAMNGDERGTPMRPPQGARGHTPVFVRDLARVELGPEFRRGALADGRSERVGGIVTMRYGANPRQVIERVHAAIARLNDPGGAVLPDGVRITPFYDRSQLIDETVSTLEVALRDEILITVFVVLLFLLHLRSSLIVASTLPIAVLASFLLMRLAGVDSNLMSLTGIAIAIGTMVDMGIVMTENCYRRLQEDGGRRPVVDVVEEAAVEVGSPLLTAVLTTIVSFVPIFFLTDTEGKLFRPLVWTKSLALICAGAAGILLVPLLCRLLLTARRERPPLGRGGRIKLAAAAILLGGCVAASVTTPLRPWTLFVVSAVGCYVVGMRLANERLSPIDDNPVSRFIERAYGRALDAILRHKALFCVAPVVILLAGVLAAFGARATLAPAARLLGGEPDEFRPALWLEKRFGGLGREFMPPLDEGSLLYMPSLLPQASPSEVLAVLRRQNAQFESIPEVAKVMGKLGRAESALDPAPVGMIETVIVLAPRDTWRPGLQKTDIINELIAAAHTPGVLEGAGAMLQPIETRVLMLDAGIRAPLAIKLIGQPRGADGRALDAKDGAGELERAAERVRDVLRSVPGVAGPNVENLGGKPYVEVEIDREAVGHYGLTVGAVQDTLTTAVGGMIIGTTVEGRERYSIRVAYQRERRNRIDELPQVLLKTSTGAQVPLALVARIDTRPGPAAIKTEDGRLRLHVTFAAHGRDEASVAEAALERIDSWRRSERRAGRADPIPAGVAVEPAGRHEAASRASDRLAVLIPVCAAIIALLIYLQFRSWARTAIVFSALPVCVAGGLFLLAFYPDLRDACYAVGLWDAPSTGPIHVTVAVVVGFIALAGIADDDGVLLVSYLDQVFAQRKPATKAAIRAAVVEAGLRRIRPCLMTTFTTIIALFPILASSGRGADVAQPMAIPAVGGMVAGLVSLFIVPTIYCWREERACGRG